MRRVEVIVTWLLRLLPALALFSALFAAEGDLRWIGLLGILPLIMAFQRGCPSCGVPARRWAVPGWTPWAGH